MAVAQTAADKLEKTRQSLASLQASYNYQYIIGAVLLLFVIRNVIIKLRRFNLSRQNQQLKLQKENLNEKDIKSPSFSHSTTQSKYFLIGVFDKLEFLGNKPIVLNFFPFSESRETGLNWCQFIVLTFICIVNIVFNLTTTTRLSTPSTVNSNIARAFARRTGRIAVANFPILYGLAGRNNLVSLLTGVQDVKFIHKALGRIVVLEVFLHTFTYIGYYATGPGMLKLYGEYTEDYFKWGIVASVGSLLLFAFSLRMMRGLYYELFLISHIIGAIMMLAGAFYHQPIIVNWVYAGAAFWAFEHAVRIGRKVSSLVSTRLFFRKPILAATVKVIAGAILLRVPYAHSNWKAGQHCYISFWGIDLLKKPWLYGQSHPFSISNMPNLTLSNSKGEEQSLKFVLRIKDGLTKTLAQHIVSKCDSTGLEEIEIKVSLEGPYSGFEKASEFETVLLIAGGSGITYLASILADVANQAKELIGNTSSLKLVWCIHHLDQSKWLGSTLADVEVLAKQSNIKLKIDLYITRSELASPSSINSLEIDKFEEKSGTSTPRSNGAITIRYGRPDLANVIRESVSHCPGKTLIIACGPAELSTQTRFIAAEFTSEQVEVVVPLYHVC